MRAGINMPKVAKFIFITGYDIPLRLYNGFHPVYKAAMLEKFING